MSLLMHICKPQRHFLCQWQNRGTQSHKTDSRYLCTYSVVLTKLKHTVLIFSIISMDLRKMSIQQHQRHQNETRLCLIKTEKFSNYDFYYQIFKKYKWQISKRI